GDLRERREQQVAHRMAVCGGAVGKSMLQERLERRVARRERYEAVAHVSWRQHAEALPQLAGTAAIISHGDDARHRIRIVLAEIRCEAGEPLENRWQTRAAAECGDARAGGVLTRTFANRWCERQRWGRGASRRKCHTAS